MIWPRYSRHRRHHKVSWIYQTKVRKYEHLSNFIDLSDMHSAEIAKCLKNHGHHLRTLNLARNRLTDEGIGQVVRAVCDTQIESLDIQGNKITEKAVDGIVGCLKTNKSLKVLDLSNNGIGSRLMKNKLKNALPQIEVLI